eukprot:gene565-1223_t
MFYGGSFVESSSSIATSENDNDNDVCGGDIDEVVGKKPLRNMTTVSSLIRVSNEDDDDDTTEYGVKTESVTADKHFITLNDYPRATNRKYVINKYEQHHAIWGDLLGSKGRISFHKQHRGQAIECVLFWLSSLVQFSALVLSFSKDTMSGKEILRATILELLLAMLGICVACYKQWKSWSFLVKFDINSEHFTDNGRNSGGRFEGKTFHIGGFIITSNLVGCSMLFCGFILLLFFDRHYFSFLKSMVYFTGLTIFVLFIVDNIIMSKLLEAKCLIQQDKVKLILHEMKEELFQELQTANKYHRVKILRDYFLTFPIFQLKQKDYIFPV